MSDRTCDTCAFRSNIQSTDKPVQNSPCEYCFSTPQGNAQWVREKQTNADRIRAMTDEELADWVLSHDCKTNLYGYLSREETLDWLKQEASDNG